MQLTERIYQELFQAILRGEFRPGQRFPTEQEAMERFGASRITVRRAFARLEENRVISRKQKVGSVVNTTFAATSGKIGMIGALVPISDHFARSFLNTLCGEAARRDAVTVLEPGNSGQEQNKAVMRLVLHGVRDLVVWGIDRELNLDLFLRLRILGVNMVFFDRINPGKIADYVCLDNAEAVRTLLDIAVRQGVRRIFFADPLELDIDTNHERLAYCRRECAARELLFSAEIPAKFPPDSAVFAVNDQVALDFAGRGVPVFSIDGLPESRARGIVSYRQPMTELAQSCFQALREQRRLGDRWKAREYRIAAEEPLA